MLHFDLEFVTCTPKHKDFTLKMFTGLQTTKQSAWPSLRMHAVVIQLIMIYAVDISYTKKLIIQGTKNPSTDFTQTTYNPIYRYLVSSTKIIYNLPNSIDFTIFFDTSTDMRIHVI